MKRAAAWGAIAGTGLGLVLALLQIVLLGDDLVAAKDLDQLGAARATVVVFTAVLGALLGTVGAMLALRVAVSGDLDERRPPATGVAVAFGLLLTLVVTPLGPAFVPAVVLAVVVSGVVAWRALPALTAHDRVTPRRPGAAAEPIQLTPGKRVVAAVVSALLGGLITTNILVWLISAVTSLSRSTMESVAIGVFVVMALLLGTLSWRRTDPSADRA